MKIKKWNELYLDRLIAQSKEVSFLGQMPEPYNKKTKDKFEHVYWRFIMRDYDGVSQAEAEAFQILYGPNEKAYRSIREMYIFASGLVDNEYIKYLHWTLKEIKALWKYNKEAGKEALNWFNIRVAPYNNKTKTNR